MVVPCIFRILNLHFPLPFVPRKAFEKKISIIHIMRNPKDVCVSYYNHYNTLPLYTPVENFSAFLPMFTGENGFCKFSVSVVAFMN